MILKYLLVCFSLFAGINSYAQVLEIKAQNCRVPEADIEKIKKIARFEKDLYNNLFNTSANDSLILKVNLLTANEYKAVIKEQSGLHNTLGFYTSKLDQCFVMKRSNYLNVIIHEFSHCFLRHNLAKAPRWVNEGIAEFCGTMVIDEDKVAYTVSMQRLYPLKAMLSASKLNLRKFMHDGDREWFGTGTTGEKYTISYSIIYFLIKKQPDMLKQMLLLMGDGQNSYEALTNTYGSFAKFEQDYLAFYKGFISFPT